MKQIKGVFLPDHDNNHIAAQIDAGPTFAGKGTFQFHKWQAAVCMIHDYRHAVDVGAHCGLWSRVFERQFQKLTAFEPFEDHIECFRANVPQRDGVVLHQVALGDHNGLVRIKTNLKCSGWAHVDDDGETSAPMRMLDEYDLYDVDFIKIDVEGYEYQVVKGAEKTIRKWKPTIVLEQKPNNAERYGRKQNDALNLLVEWGGTDKWDIGGDHCVRWKKR
jgi:FkbM family methyltransferase